MGSPWTHSKDAMKGDYSIIVFYRCGLCDCRYPRERVVNSPKAAIQLAPPSVDTHTLVDFEDDGCLRETVYIPKFEKHECGGADEGRGYAVYCGYYIAHR